MSNLIGERFGRLFVVGQGVNIGTEKAWVCRCDCGQAKTVRNWSLLHSTRSCGCLRSDGQGKTLVGQTFHRLTVIKRDLRIATKVWTWVCQCECGNTSTVRGTSLRSGHTKSCGCLHREAAMVQAAKPRAQAKRRQHGHALHGEQSPTYRSWKGAKNRCFNLNEPSWWDYGGRGITMCDRWREDFAAFLADMGEAPPGLSLDRINNSGNYEPGNCRWATRAEQQENQRPRRTFTPPSYWTAEERIEALQI